MTRPLPLAWALAPLAGLLLGSASAQVDEPLGARYSLGLTLPALAHDAARVREFHAFLESQGVPPESLATTLKAPELLHAVLLEPERLPEADRNGWQVKEPWLASGAGDSGPTVRLPLRLPAAGVYHLWVRFTGWTNGTAVTSLKIYRKGAESAGPLLDDELYDYAAASNGPAWKDLLVDLPAGDFTVQLGHVTRWWHAGNGPRGYLPRQVDCLLLTERLWDEAPSDAALEDLRKSAPDGIQYGAALPLPPGEQGLWRRWQVRPAGWDQAAGSPRLFALGRAFQRQLVDTLAKTDFGDTLPDYRLPGRQVYFNDDWNMIGNPARIRRQIDALKSDIRPEPTPHLYYWLQAGDFEPSGYWEKAGPSLTAGYGDFSGDATASLPVERAALYTVWVRIRILNGYYAPWRLTVAEPGGKTVQFDRDQNQYSNEWQRVGTLEAQAGDLRFKIVPLRYKAPGTYRWVHDFVVTTDPDFAPQGTVRPPITRDQYRARAAALGAGPTNRFLLAVVPDAVSALAQDWWPRQPLPAGDQEIHLTLPRNATRVVQLWLRSTADEPLPLQVACSAPAGLPPIAWRVIGFAPYGRDFRQDWSPFVLLRRPGLTLPPLNVAGLHLTVDSHGAAAGEHTAAVTLTGPGVARTVTLRIHVSPVEIAPKQPVLVGGWTAPPEGEAYRRDYQAHGMRIWYKPLPKEDMTRYGIRLLALSLGAATTNSVRSYIEQLKGMGLDYGDWVFTIRDEPCGKTDEELKPFLDTARAVREADPKARLSFNPGEAAGLETFQILDPFCDFWLPYRHHLVYPPQQAAAKRAIITAKTWMWYTTPCYGDKSPEMAAGLYNQIRQIPAQPGRCVGTAFFAFYYPFRDPWDTAYEHIPDVSVVVLPGLHGPVPTLAWEAVREAVQHADLATMIREQAPPEDPAAAALAATGSVEALLGWLEKKPD